jgi:hypothetical protein
MARRNENTDEVETTDEAATAEGEETKSKSKKTPLPDGYQTPVGFTHVLKEQRGVDVRPQVIYGYVRNNKAFQEFSGTNEGDGRVILNVERALAWWDEKEAKKAEREQKKAAEAAAEESADA